jgi:hypothetical protein
MSITVDSYKKMVAPVVVDDIDFASFASSPLDEDARRCLRYMHDIEMHTVCYLRDILVTASHRDAELTTFLTLWCYEEFWHGEAIAAVLEAHGEAAGSTRVGALRRSRRVKESLKPLVHGVASMVAGRSISAVQMMWGAVNEWTTQASYAQLSRRADHPVLTTLLHRIMRQEGRHIDFYTAQATTRLEGNKHAQAITRTALRKLWAPVGSDVQPESEVRHLIGYLFGGDDGLQMAERIDRRIDRLPGLSDLRLVTTARDRYTSIT